MRRWLRTILAIVLPLTVATPLHAQAVKGALLGNLTDEAGLAVPGATVTITEVNTNISYNAVTNENGEYEFLTILPGAYPWRNTYNAWRPAHIHFSVFGPAFATRLVTQMYFPGDPLLALDPIYNSVPDPVARLRLVSAYDPQLNQAEYALGYRFDIVVRGRNSTPFEGRR